MIQQKSFKFQVAGCAVARTHGRIAATTGIKESTLYKWKTSNVRLSPDKADALLLYFIHNEPQRLEDAEIVLAAHNNQ